MSDLSEFYANNLRRGPICSIKRGMAKLDPKRAALFQQALDDIDLSAVAISKTLRGWGVDVGTNAIQRHRTRDCACDR